MKITFLGTSHGVPFADRYCSCTMIETGGSVYFIDGGAPLINLLLKYDIDLTTLRALFATHTHGDHINGVPDLVNLLNWYFKQGKLQVYMPEQNAIDAIRNLLWAMDTAPLDEERLPMRAYSEGFVYEDENIRVTPLPTRHMEHIGRPAFGFLVEAEGKKIYFSGDMSGQLEKQDFPAYTLENEVDLLVCEMAHFDVEHVAPYLEKCKAKQVLFNHVFPVYKFDKINALNGKYGYPIRTVNDGEVIEL